MVVVFVPLFSFDLRIPIKASPVHYFYYIGIKLFLLLLLYPSSFNSFLYELNNFLLFLLLLLWKIVLFLQGINVVKIRGFLSRLLHPSLLLTKTILKFPNFWIGGPRPLFFWGIGDEFLDFYGIFNKKMIFLKFELHYLLICLNEEEY